jgi:hypothetical protein
MISCASVFVLSLSNIASEMKANRANYINDLHIRKDISELREKRLCQ